MVPCVAFCEAVEVLRVSIGVKSLGHCVVPSCQNYQTHKEDCKVFFHLFSLSESLTQVTTFTKKYMHNGLESLMSREQINVFSL